ncbi:MAG: hypothetical protein HY438_00050 [DPANN group archaeon]|nr:hypothetical protein [DPANN group archaeon]
MKIELLKSEQRERVLSELIERFGFDKKVFDSFEFYRTKDNVYACSKGAIELAKGIAGVQDLGFAFARFGVNLKITTNIVQLIGRFAKKNFIVLNSREARQFIAGEDVAFEEGQTNATNGFVIVRLGDDNLGVGFLRDKNMKNLLPGAKQLPTI